ncbi:MAG: hypothetical protein HOM55_01580 [Proteobacteria bacterium]|jgi:hypothetical protein|nr:hypothetical protein [Pseudomonadota bacterium]
MMTYHSLDFRQTATLLSKRFGNLNLGINPLAQSLQEMLPLDGIHRPVVHNMLQEIYHQNRCASLDATICVDPTFDALGKLAWDLKSAKYTDVDALALIEQIGDYLAELFTLKPDNKEPEDKNSTITTEPSSCTVRFRAPR